VHELLAPGDGRREDALAACRAYLRRTWRRWTWAERLIPVAPREGLVAVLTWQRLTRESARAPGFERRRGLDELRRELERALAEQARSPAGVVLGWAVRRHALEASWFRGPLEAWSRDQHLATFETREALLTHARALATPEARALLAVAGRRDPRREVLADALGTALQLSDWLAHLRDEFAAGRLRLPLDEVLRAGADLSTLFEGHGRAPLAALVRDAVHWTRGFYEKGWPLCRELGPWEGRVLAFVLRWNAAALTALEYAGCEPRSGGPPAGWPRLVSCGLAGLATRRAPRLRV
jgi:phytoene/squalene synthetase